MLRHGVKSKKAEFRNTQGLEIRENGKGGGWKEKKGRKQGSEPRGWDYVLATRLPGTLGKVENRGFPWAGSPGKPKKGEYPGIFPLLC